MDKQEITPDEAIAGVKENEELVFANCPCCNARLAVYIARDKADVDLAPKSADPLAP